MFLWRAPELSCKYQLSNHIFHFRPNTRQALCTKLTHVHKHRTKVIQMLDFQKTFSFLTVQSCCGYRFKMSKNEWAHLVVRCTRFHYVLRAHALLMQAWSVSTVLLSLHLQHALTLLVDSANLFPLVYVTVVLPYIVAVDVEQWQGQGL